MGFTTQVLNIFSKKIQEYNLKVDHESEYSVFLKFNKFEINIYKEYSNVFAEIIDNKDEKYDLGLLYSLVLKLNFNTYNDVLDTEEKNRQQLNNYLEIISVILKDIGAGNFEWKNKYAKYYTDLRYIQFKMGSKFSFNHPIYNKFISNDLTWKIDLENGV
ncbi:hypothetical protein [Flavobacterium sp. UBA7682]|uniref:hypothetical protein n=1 Tax=Flavobacterium sp. UBA7682 TaxID=1946560 RepID=UPI0025BD1E6F|nr:hypothetical protein [Flavobacterium sp. UBA7682]